MDHANSGYNLLEQWQIEFTREEPVKLESFYYFLACLPREKWERFSKQGSSSREAGGDGTEPHTIMGSSLKEIAGFSY